MSGGKFLFCPSRAGALVGEYESSDSTGFYNCVERFLKTADWTPTKDSNKAELLVLMPRIRDRVTVNDVRWLGQNCGKKGTAVLVVDPHQSFAALRPDIVPLYADVLPWLRVISQIGDELPFIREWLNTIRKNIKDIRDSLNSPLSGGPSILTGVKDIQLLLLKVAFGLENVSNATDEFNKIIDKLKKRGRIGRKTTPSLLKSIHIHDLYFGLVRIGSKYGKIEHDINRAINIQSAQGASPSSGILAELGQLRHDRQFIDACLDILTTLRHPMLAPKGERNVILLVDDRPQLIARDLAAVAKQLMPEYQLWVWEPSGQARIKKELTLEGIMRYNSSRVGTVNAENNIQVRDAKGEILLSENNNQVKDANGELISNEYWKLRGVLDRCAFILVDLLFESPDGGEDQYGYGVIRGLIRLMHDRTKETSTSNPEVIAISRADDQEKIQACLLAGAVGYVLKNRLLAMPSALDRARHAVTEPPNAWHRNFRSLYNLPRETIGLLKSAKIEALDSKRRLNRNHIITPIQHSTAALLKHLPKTDLHVHVGSLMSPEFLSIASIVMLLRHKETSSVGKDIIAAIPLFNRFWHGLEDISLYLHPGFNFREKGQPEPLKFIYCEEGIKIFAKKVRKFLIEQIKFFSENRDRDPDTEKGESGGRSSPNPIDDELRMRYYDFRSLLHNSLGVRDHLSEAAAIKEIETTPPINIFLFALSHSVTRLEQSLPGQKPDVEWVFKSKPNKRVSDVLRMFILFLSVKQGLKFILDTNILNKWFKHPDKLIASSPGPESDWTKFRELFYGDHSVLSYKKLRKDGWSLPKRLSRSELRLAFETDGSRSRKNFKFLNKTPDFKYYPLTYLLATGTRSANLLEYLEGCELSGSEHLQHPYLMHLYAQHVVYKFAVQGILYAELRAAASGYECHEIDFSFYDACRCLTTAFANAQETFNKSTGQKIDVNSDVPIWLWDKPYSLSGLFHNQADRELINFPVKVGITLTGKRHKPTREMLREAAGALVLHTRPPSKLNTAREFARDQLQECRLVGFDLAGKEEGYPPERFRVEFEPLSRLHIPITVHAGENAKSDYIENAVLDLRARRLGHGLALPEDPQLMGRVREDSVCVELCPVSNFQTSRFVPAGSDGNGREYPIQLFINEGIAFCINTDNPIISDTNIIKEYFQAAYACGKKGLSLWELLRIIRMGFVHSFMSLTERRAMLELADQILFDFFTRDDVVAFLRILSSQQQKA